MLIQKVRKIGVLASRCRSLAWFLVFTFSFFWSLEGVFAQYTVTATKTYTSSGTFTITDLSDITGLDPTSEIFGVANVDVLIVGGGGGGGRGNSAGGGGGGQVLTPNIDLNLGAALNITIGQGGRGARQSGNTTSNNGLAGGTTSVNLTSGSTSINYTANGGQGGAANGNAGASGNGNAGGSASGSGQNAKGGGGGGAGGPGINGIGTGTGSTGGNGGNGVTVSITGNMYGAGGGGNGRRGGNGGLGGGGNANPSGPGDDASPNSGSGGGAGSPGNEGGNGSNGIVVVQITYRILPVEFLYFNTSYQSKTKSALLEWSTAKEWENSHFEIERAVNSVKEWETIGRVDGNGYSNSQLEYKFIDTDLPISGGNIFYRLKQVDFSGGYSYSKTKAIQIERNQNTTTWIVYPNPSTIGSSVNIQLLQIQDYQDQPISIRLVNMLGAGESHTLSSPIEVSQVVADWMRSKNAGIYILDIRWDSNFQQIKLLRN